VSRTKITIIGAGLAGSEAAHQLASQAAINDIDISIDLYEMRPTVKTPAHHSDKFAELVCSNSLGSELLTTARGLLIAEMELLDSLIIRSAKQSKVPAGQALAVDRELFSEIITNELTKFKNINIIREEITSLNGLLRCARNDDANHNNANTSLRGVRQQGEAIHNSDYIVIATGPLTSEALAANISQVLAEGIASSPSAPRNDGNAFLHFFDAASPILSADTINMDIAFKASRYGKGEDDYINCPFYEQEDFDRFYEALVTAEQAPQKDFEQKAKFFESCLPIEEIARRGKKTLCFGPLKPVGLRDPRNPDRRPVAVVQLRQDNGAASLYNIVGFQTNLKWGEQKRVFAMIPGLENAEIVRYGVMHQNIYIHSPSLLTPSLNLKSNPQIYFAGQITGVEGYTESAATGIVVARDIIAKLKQRQGDCFAPTGLAMTVTQGDCHATSQLAMTASFKLPAETMLGALINYVSSEEIAASKQDFQPMNSNWGLINHGLDPKLARNKKLRNETLVARSLSQLNRYAKIKYASHAVAN